jgi:hypothetical protein
MPMQVDQLKKLASTEGRQEAYLALRAWAKAKPKRAAATALGIVLSILWVYDHYGHPGQVLDGVTGEPLEGVFVIRRWAASGTMGLHSRMGCYQMRITQSNAAGKYYLPRWSWSIIPGSLFASVSGQGTAFYKPGYYQAADPIYNTDERTWLWPENRSVEARLWTLTRSIEDGDCGGGDTYKSIRLPLYEAIAEEGESIARTKSEESIASSLRFRADLLRFDELSIATRNQRRPEPKREKR